MVSCGGRWWWWRWLEEGKEEDGRGRSTWLVEGGVGREPLTLAFWEWQTRQTELARWRWSRDLIAQLDPLNRQR